MASGWQERLLEEKRDLDGKRGRLEMYFESDEWHTLPQVDRDLLRIQSLAMATYSNILGMRIGAIKPAEPVA